VREKAGRRNETPFFASGRPQTRTGTLIRLRIVPHCWSSDWVSMIREQCSCCKGRRGEDRYVGIARKESYPVDRGEVTREATARRIPEQIGHVQGVGVRRDAIDGLAKKEAELKGEAEAAQTTLLSRCWEGHKSSQTPFRNQLSSDWFHLRRCDPRMPVIPAHCAPPPSSSFSSPLRAEK